MPAHSFYLFSLCFVWILAVSSAEVVQFGQCDDNQPGIQGKSSFVDKHGFFSIDVSKFFDRSKVE